MLFGTCQAQAVHCCCSDLTRKDLRVVVAQGQGANSHDLGNGAEPEVLVIPYLLQVLQAVGSVPAQVGKTRSLLFTGKQRCYACTAR